MKVGEHPSQLSSYNFIIILTLGMIMKIQASKRLQASTAIDKTYNDLITCGLPDKDLHQYTGSGVLIKKSDTNNLWVKLRNLGYRLIDSGSGYEDYHAPGKATISFIYKDNSWEVHISE